MPPKFYCRARTGQRLPRDVEPVDVCRRMPNRGKQSRQSRGRVHLHHNRIKAFYNMDVDANVGADAYVGRIRQLVGEGHPGPSARIIARLEHEKGVAVQEKASAVHEKHVAMHEKHIAMQEKHVAMQEKHVAMQEKDAAVQEKDAAVRVAEQSVFAAIALLTDAGHWWDPLAACKSTCAEPPLISILSRLQVCHANCRQVGHPQGADAPEVAHCRHGVKDTARVHASRARGCADADRLDLDKDIESAWKIVCSDPSMRSLRDGVIRLNVGVGMLGALLQERSGCMVEG